MVTSMPGPALAGMTKAAAARSAATANDDLNPVIRTLQGGKLFNGT
jgi:hypothetical protein